MADPLSLKLRNKALGLQAASKPLSAALREISLRTPTGPAKPIFALAPSIAGIPQVGQTLSVTSTVLNGAVVSRRWLLGATVVATTATYKATAGGLLFVEETANGPGGTTVATSGAVTVAEAAATPTPTPTGSPPSLAQFIEAYNQEGANYYIPVPIHNDWGRYCTVQANTLYVPYAGFSGAHTVETDANFTGGTHATIANFQKTAGGISFTITGDCTDTDARGFTFTGDAPTYFRVTRVGRAGKWAQEALDGWKGRGWRDLDVGYTNKVVPGPRIDTGAVDAPFYQLTDKGCLLPIEDRADFHAAKMASDPNFFLLWHVIPSNWSLADIRAALVLFRDRCPPTAAFVLQWGNEDPWNDRFPGVRTIYVQAFKAGHYGAATWNNPQPSITVKADCDTGSAGNAASPASVAGDRVLYDLQGTVGRSIWKAKQAVPAGTEINENAFWAREYDQNFVRDAARKYRTRMLWEVDQLAREVFGAERYAKQVFPCMMAQHGTDGEIYNQMAVERTYIPGFFDGSATQAVRIAGCAGYLDESDMGRSSFDYNNVTPASLDAGIRAAFVSYKARIRKFVADCAQMNVIPGFYELSIAPLLPNSASYEAAYSTYSRSDAYRLLMKDFGEFWRAACPGIVMFYDAVGDKIGTNPSTCFNLFSLQTTWNDKANPRFVGWRQGIAITPTPAPTPTPTPGSTAARKVKNMLIRIASTADTGSSMARIRELVPRDGAGERVAGFTVAGDNYNRESYPGDGVYASFAGDTADRLGDGNLESWWTGMPFYAAGPELLRIAYPAAVNLAELNINPLTAASAPGKFKVWVSEGAIGDDGSGGTLVLDVNETSPANWAANVERLFALI